MSDQEQPENPKNPPGKSHARGKPAAGLNSAHLAKVIKKAAQIADMMTAEDIAADLKVLRDAKKACHHVFDTKTKKLKKVPDHKTRLAATTLSRAYHEGKPVEQSIAVTVDAEDFPGLVAKLASSPAFQAKISEQKTVEGKEILPEWEDPPSEIEDAGEEKS